jgi:hypothetical protein
VSIFATFSVLFIFQNVRQFRKGELLKFSVISFFHICGFLISGIEVIVSFDRRAVFGHYNLHAIYVVDSNIDVLIFVALTSFSFFIQRALDQAISGDQTRTNMWISCGIVIFRVVAANIGVCISLFVQFT